MDDEWDLSEPTPIVPVVDAGEPAKEAYRFNCSEWVWNDIINCTADGSLFLNLQDTDSPSLIMGKYELGLTVSPTSSANTAQHHEILGAVQDNALILVAPIQRTLSVKPGTLPRPIESAPEPTINPSLLLEVPATTKHNAVPASSSESASNSKKRKRVVSKATVSSSSSSSDADAVGSADEGGEDMQHQTETHSGTLPTTKKNDIKATAPRSAAVNRLAQAHSHSREQASGAESSQAPTPISSPRLGPSTTATAANGNNGSSKKRGRAQDQNHRRSGSVSSTAFLPVSARPSTTTTAASTTTAKKKRRSLSHGSLTGTPGIESMDQSYQGIKLRKSTSSMTHDDAKSTSRKHSNNNHKKRRHREERWYSSTDDDDDNDNEMQEKHFIDRGRQPRARGSTHSSNQIQDSPPDDKLKIEIKDLASFESYSAQFKTAYPSYLKLHSLLMRERDRIEASTTISDTVTSTKPNGNEVSAVDTKEVNEKGGGGGSGYELDEIERLVKRLTKEREALEAIKRGLQAYKQERLAPSTGTVRR